MSMCYGVISRPTESNTMKTTKVSENWYITRIHGAVFFGRTRLDALTAAKNYIGNMNHASI